MEFSWHITAVTTNMHPPRVFPPVETWVFVHANQLFSMVFSLTLTEKVPSLLNERRRLTRIIKNDNSVFNFLIKMKCQHVIPTPTRENYGNCWLTSTKPQVWTKEKSLWGHVLVVTAVISTRPIIFISTSQISNFVFVTCSHFSKARALY